MTQDRSQLASRQRAARSLRAHNDPERVKPVKKAAMSLCRTCGRQLDVKSDPLSLDCGGDCWGCVGMMEFDMDRDLAPEQQLGSIAVRKEIEAGLRDEKGRPRDRRADV